MGVALLAAAQERGASWPSDIDLWLLFWLLYAVAYAILVLVQRQNRTRQPENIPETATNSRFSTPAQV